MNSTRQGRSTGFLDPNDISMAIYRNNSDFSTSSGLHSGRNGDQNDNVQCRKKYTEKFMQQNFSFRKVKSSNIFRDGLHYLRKNYTPSLICAKGFFLSRLPFFKWITEYNVRECLFKDAIAGLTVGIIHIPQSMAYALMAGVPAINGLYLTFFTVILYVFFGTSRHISTGFVLVFADF
jgi:hypothetical protein